MNRIKLLLIVLVSLLMVQNALAEIKLPAIISSNMVLQRQTTVTLWGWADAGEEIQIKPSWVKKALTVKADEQGNWQVKLTTTDSREPQMIDLKSASSNIKLENLLFGEVWLCSGQSNMQQPLKGYNGQPTFGSTMAIAKSSNPNLRLFSVDRVGSKVPLKDLDKYTPWQAADPESVIEFSAVAYFFGQQLQEILDVPVGLIHTSWGGSTVQPWISQEMLSQYQSVNLEEVDITSRTNHIPTALYNAMIHPLIPFNIKGVLWYQGESNRLEPEKYTELFPAMVKDWRTRWNIGDFPFFYVQIAPFLYGNNDAYQDYDNSAFIREAQLQCLDLIPNSGMAVTMDIGDDECIHPPKKKEVADRLLWNALQKTYGHQAVDGDAPVFESLEKSEEGLLLKFKHAEGGLFAFGELHGFEIAGDDKVFYPATAKIEKQMNVLVTSDKVPNPVAVRYCWKNWVEGTLFDTNLLPASSFRTDNWNDATRAVE